MKKINLLFGVLVFTFGLFVACEKDNGDAIGPDLELVGAADGYIISDVTVEPGEELDFKWIATKGDANLDFFTVFVDGGIHPDWNNVEIANAVNDTYTATATLIADDEEGDYTYRFVVTDKDGLTDEVSIDVTVEQSTTPLGEEQNLEWKRIGSAAGTGLGTFGLKWTSNLKAVSAVIAKDDASKFVELTSAQWTSIITEESLAEAIDGGTDMTDWREISAEADATGLDHVLGTKNGDNYYLIHITASDVATGGGGTTITITGKYKD